MTDTVEPTTVDTIVLIHGLWMNARCWEPWVDRYTRQGFQVIAQSWPGMEGDVEALRRDAAGIEHLGITEIVDHHDGIIRELQAPPIIMGHSFGGAFTQLLLHRGLGAAGVASDSAAVRGILTLPLSRLRSARAVAQARRVARCAALLVLRAGGRGPFARGQ